MILFRRTFNFHWPNCSLSSFLPSLPPTTLRLFLFVYSYQFPFASTLSIALSKEPFSSVLPYQSKLHYWSRVYDQSKDECHGSRLTLNIVDRRVATRGRSRRDDFMRGEIMRSCAWQIVHEAGDPDEEQEKQEHEVEHQQGVQGHQLHRARATFSTITRTCTHRLAHASASSHRLLNHALIERDFSTLWSPFPHYRDRGHFHAV